MRNGRDFKTSPTISVVIATYNRENYIRIALDSILNQTRPPDEVIVVDDGSTDGTRQIIAEYGDRIRYIHQANRGRPSALNVGIRQAQSSHIWIFDDDDIALPNAIESSLTALENHPEADFSYSYKLYYDGDGDIWDRSRWRNPQTLNSNPDRLFIELMQSCFAQLQGMIIPKRCYDAIGLFDENMVRAQDYDFILRLARRFRGVEIGCFMFVLRNHSGDRGPSFERHSHADKMKYWRHYDQLTFSRLRKEIPLHEYLPNHSSATLTEADRGAALLVRADAMYRHGLYEEGSEDLSRAIAAGAGGAEVDTLILQSTNVGEAAFVPGIAHIARTLRRLTRHNDSKQWNRSALRGFYWTLRAMLRQRRAVAAATVFYAILLLIGNEIWRLLHGVFEGYFPATCGKTSTATRNMVSGSTSRRVSRARRHPR